MWLFLYWYFGVPSRSVKLTLAGRLHQYLQILNFAHDSERRLIQEYDCISSEKLSIFTLKSRHNYYFTASRLASCE